MEKIERLVHEMGQSKARHGAEMLPALVTSHRLGTFVLNTNVLISCALSAGVTPDGDKFLEAVVGKLNYTVSDDQHLLDPKLLRGIEIVDPKTFYEFLDVKNSSITSPAPRHCPHEVFFAPGMDTVFFPEHGFDVAAVDISPLL